MDAGRKTFLESPGCDLRAAASASIAILLQYRCFSLLAALGLAPALSDEIFSGRHPTQLRPVETLRFRLR